MSTPPGWEELPREPKSRRFRHRAVVVGILTAGIVGSVAASRLGHGGSAATSHGNSSAPSTSPDPSAGGALDLSLGLTREFQTSTAAGSHNGLLSFDVSNAHAYPIELRFSDVRLPPGLSLVEQGLPTTKQIGPLSSIAVTLAIHVKNCGSTSGSQTEISIEARAAGGSWTPVLLDPSTTGLAGGWVGAIVKAACPTGG